MGRVKPKLPGRSLVVKVGFGIFKLPGIVVDFASLDVAEATDEEGITGGEEVGERILRAGGVEGAVAGVELCRRAVAAVGSVVKFPALLGHGHAGPEVGEAEGDAGAEDGKGRAGVEREEVDAGAAIRGADVGAEVEFGEAGSRGDADAVLAEGAEADLVHEEGDDAEPGPAVEGVDTEAGGELALDVGGGDGPVGEEEFGPALTETPRAGGGGPGSVCSVERGRVGVVGHVWLDAGAVCFGHV